jgi:ATP-binding cassette, subfamily B (MDR/TAP), member 7
MLVSPSYQPPASKQLSSPLLVPPSSDVLALLSTRLWLTDADGLARIGSAVFQELRNAIFANVAQKAIRQVACNTFSHLLSMDLAFHLSRQTGGLSRAIDRGTKGISSMLTWIVFHIAPTLLEIVLVSGILGYKFGWEYAGVAIGTMGLYILFTVKTTAWRYCHREIALTTEQNSGNRPMQQIIKQRPSSLTP